MAGQMVQFPIDGGTTSGYLAKPASGSGPGVLVIHEWWGLNDQIKGVADRFASEGFVALVPDLFDGKLAADPKEAGALMGAVNMDEAAKDFRGAASYLRQQSSTAKVGVVGFCMGGALVYHAAGAAADTVGAACVFYSVGPTGDLAKVKAPVMGNYGATDTMTPPDMARGFEEQLKKQGVETDFKIYPGVGHAFFNEKRADAYNEAAANDAWQRTLGFFRKHLK